uniref:Uncharacterized protein n=1 Tax=Sinocyclocheilus anshuiensis TaxID=1608454 RepID=A0A671SB81_9TELE
MTSLSVFKVVFLGNSAVGKSSFIHHYCSGHFPNNLALTVGETLDLCPDTVDLIAKILFKLSWMLTSLNSMMNCL